MFFSDFLVALVVSVVLTALFGLILRRKGPWASVFTFFVVDFLVTWAVGIWITPVMPTARTVQWTPFIVVGLITALLLAAAVPSWYRNTGTEPAQQAERRKPPVALLTPYYWLALILLVIAIIAR